MKASVRGVRALASVCQSTVCCSRIMSVLRGSGGSKR
jgi:hypothetical protein